MNYIVPLALAIFMAPALSSTSAFAGNPPGELPNKAGTPVSVETPYPTAEELYNALSTGEALVLYTNPITGEPFVGSQVTEKNRRDVFCWKVVPTAPHAQPSFECFKNVSDQINAEAKYQMMNVDALILNFKDPQTGEPLNKTIITEKRITTLICRRFEIQDPARPIVSFACYSKLLI